MDAKNWLRDGANKSETLDRDAELLRLREQLILAKEEAAEKTKLVVQLQKQLVDSEKTPRGPLGVGSSGGSLIGALLGAASGESQELLRLKRELDVQREELANKIRQNEQLQIRHDEGIRENEREKRMFSQVLDAEVKRATKFEKLASKKIEEVELLSAQHEALARDLSDKSRKLHDTQTQLMLLKKANQLLQRRANRESERTTLLSSYPSNFSAIEIVLCLRDIAFWCNVFKNENLVVEGSQTADRALEALIGMFNKIDIERVIDDPFSFLDEVHKLCRPLQSYLPLLIAPTLRAFSDAVDDSILNDSQDKQMKLKRLLKTLKAEFSAMDIQEDGPELHIVKAILDIVQSGELMVKDKAEARTQANFSTPKPANLQSDESLLNSIEHCIEESKQSSSSDIGQRLSPVNESFSHGLESILSFSSSNQVKPPVEEEYPSTLKKQYHVLSLNNLRRIRQLEEELIEWKARAQSTDLSMKTLQEERDSAVCKMEELRTKAKKAREELDETKASYDLQLRNFSDRIMELEKLLKQKEEEIRQLRGEGLLLGQIKKSFTQKST